MKQQNWMRFGLFAVLLVIAVAGYRAIVWYKWREKADVVTGVAVELGPAYQVIKVGESPDLFVTIVNRGDKEVKLVEPGDGSESALRTPLIEWSYSNYVPGGCGVINPLEAKEVFILEPRESRQVLTGKISPPFSRPGLYRAAIRYTNRPEQPLVCGHTASVLQEVRTSTKVSAVSNSVEIVVKE